MKPVLFEDASKFTFCDTKNKKLCMQFYFNFKSVKINKTQC